MASLILAVVLCVLVGRAKAGCGDCQKNAVACISWDSFSLCQNGSTLDEIVSCPEGKMCTNNSVICMSDDGYIRPSCGKGCGVCNSHDKVFSCMSRTEVVFCFGEDRPYLKARTNCTDGHLCDTSNRSICVQRPDNAASCNEILDSPETTTSTTSTVQPPRDAATFCRGTAMEGTFPAEGDTTCKMYFICKPIKNGTDFIGYLYTCDVNDYFNPDTRLCQEGRPDNC